MRTLTTLALALVALLATAQPAAAAPMRMHVPILMYHRIQCPDAATRLPGNYVCPAALDAQMAALEDRGWHTITADELAADMAAGTCPGPRTFVVTVDDGALDGYTNGAPIWEAHGYRASFAMVTDKAGDYLQAGWPGKANPDKPHFSWDQARDLLARGHDLINHTTMHNSVANASTDKLQRVVAGAQDDLERELGYRPAVFVYPYGSTGTTEASWLAGRFTLALTTKAGANEDPKDPMHAPRVRVSHSTTVAGLLSKLAPWQDPC